MNNLTITKEKVLEAAAKCSTAKATLEILFPEAFEDDGCSMKRLDATVDIKQAFKDLSRMLGLDEYSIQLLKSARRDEDIKYEGRALFLSNHQWEIKSYSETSTEAFILIPKKKL